MSINNNEYILQVYILILPYISQSLQFYERLIVIFNQPFISHQVLLIENGVLSVDGMALFLGKFKNLFSFNQNLICSQRAKCVKKNYADILFCGYVRINNLPFLVEKGSNIIWKFWPLQQLLSIWSRSLKLIPPPKKNCKSGICNIILKYRRMLEGKINTQEILYMEMLLLIFLL